MLTHSHMDQFSTMKLILSKFLLFVLAAFTIGLPPLGNAADLVGVDIKGGIYEFDSVTGEQSPGVFTPDNPADGGIGIDAMARHPDGGTLYAIIHGNTLVWYNGLTHEMTELAVFPGIQHISSITFGVDNSNPNDVHYALYGIAGQYDNTPGKIYRLNSEGGSGYPEVPTDTGFGIPGDYGFAIEANGSVIYGFGTPNGPAPVTRFWLVDMPNQDVLSIPMGGVFGGGWLNNPNNNDGIRPPDTKITAIVSAGPGSNQFYIYDRGNVALLRVDLGPLIGHIATGATVTKVADEMGPGDVYFRGSFKALARSGSSLQGAAYHSLFTFSPPDPDYEISKRTVPIFDSGSNTPVKQVFRGMAKHPTTMEYWVIINDRLSVTYEADDLMVGGAVGALDIKTGQISKVRSMTEWGITGIVFIHSELYGVTGPKSLRGAGHIVKINRDTGRVSESSFSGYQHEDSDKHKLAFDPNPFSPKLYHFFHDENFNHKVETIYVSNSQTGPTVALSQDVRVRGVVYGGGDVIYAMDRNGLHSVTPSGETTYLAEIPGGFWVFNGLELGPGPPIVNNAVLKASLNRKLKKLKRKLKVAKRKKQKTSIRRLKKQISKLKRRLRSL